MKKEKEMPAENEAVSQAAQSEKNEAEELKAALAEKEKTILELTDKYQRSLAEFDNLRKRTRKEKEAVYPEAVCAAVSAMLPVLDSLERADAQPSSDAEYKKGVELVLRQFLASLEKLGVTPVGEAGESFDPNFHNAVFHEENAELGENVITEVLSKGYAMGERVIRAAMVKVAN